MEIGNEQFGQMPSLIQCYAVGTGRVDIQPSSTLFHLGENDGKRYSDAQIDDYHHDGILRWRPPVVMHLRARFSNQETELKGTAGFGFWNDPFGITKIDQTQRQLPRLRFPQATWFFFASPPSKMDLAMGVPGFGWKAATIDASRPLTKILLPFAPLGMLASRLSWGYGHMWPIAQHVLKIDEAIVPLAMDEWHDYRIVWGRESVRFQVDGVEHFHARYAPRGPLGFVAWIDNQYMVATPRGELRNGVIASGEQWMEISALELREV